MRRSQQGIGLLELLLALSILAVMGLMAVRYYSTAHSSEQVTLANSMIADIYSASTDYAQQANFNASGFNLAALIHAGLLSNYYTVNPWQGKVTVSLLNQRIIISMTAVPADACQKLSSRLQPTFSSSTESALCPSAAASDSSGSGSDGAQKQGVLVVSYDLY